MIVPSLSAGGLLVGLSEEREDYAGPDEIARVLRVSPRTVIRWADNGWLSGSIVLSAYGLFRSEDLEALTEQVKRQKDGTD